MDSRRNLVRSQKAPPRINLTAVRILKEIGLDLLGRVNLLHKRSVHILRMGRNHNHVQRIDLMHLRIRQEVVVVQTAKNDGLIYNLLAVAKKLAGSWKAKISFCDQIFTDLTGSAVDCRHWGVTEMLIDDSSHWSIWVPKT